LTAAAKAAYAALEPKNILNKHAWLFCETWVALVGIRGGGCSGFNYVIEFSDDPPRAKDIVHQFEGVRFYVDPKSLIYLGGSTLDYEHTLMFQGFRFKNPQEASRCGCGHSFTVR